MYPKNIKILIVDDMSTMRKVIRKSLRELGFEDVQEAADGQLGWELLQNANPAIQLVISDWNMPNMTGLELLDKVRTESRFAKIPFLLLTAESETTQVMDAVKKGVTNYIVKPFTSDILKAKLEAAHKKAA